MHHKEHTALSLLLDTITFISFYVYETALICESCAVRKVRQSCSHARVLFILVCDMDITRARGLYTQKRVAAAVLRSFTRCRDLEQSEREAGKKRRVFREVTLMD